MLPIGSIASESGTAIGVLAGMIAVGGFLAHAPRVLFGAPAAEVQRATAIGGLAGFGFGALVVFLSAIVSAGAMTFTTRIVLIIGAGCLVEAVAVLGLAALGVRGPIISFGGLVPLAVVSLACSSAVANHWPEDPVEKKHPRQR